MVETTPVEEWWEGGSSIGSIDEEDTKSEYYMNLGAETPGTSTPNLVENSAFVKQWAAAGIAVPKALVRRASWRSLKGREQERSKSSRKDNTDRDCGICFEYAVKPCRTLCCGKIFCTEHLADWLHGPNAEGRCPNCENACSLEGGTLSLVSQGLAPPSQIPKNGCSRNYPSSPLSTVHPHQNNTLPLPRDQSILPGSSPVSTGKKTSASSTTSLSSVATSIDTNATAQEDEDNSPLSAKHKLEFGITPAATASTTPFSTSWGAVSRLMSLLTFLMFLYKLLS